MKKMICFDMDGTIADLYGVDKWLDKLHNECVEPYVDAKPLWDIIRLNNILAELKSEGWIIAVISWVALNASAEYKKATAQAKKEWIKKYNLPIDEIHITKYGATKADSVRKKADYAILIDDNEKVRKGWNLGITINPIEENIIDRLIELKKEDII